VSKSDWVGSSKSDSCWVGSSGIVCNISWDSCCGQRGEGAEWGSGLNSFKRVSASTNETSSASPRIKTLSCSMIFALVSSLEVIVLISLRSVNADTSVTVPKTLEA